MTAAFQPGDIVVMDLEHPRWKDEQLRELFADMLLFVEGKPGELYIGGRRGARHSADLPGFILDPSWADSILARRPTAVPTVTEFRIEQRFRSRDVP